MCALEVSIEIIFNSFIQMLIIILGADDQEFDMLFENAEEDVNDDVCETEVISNHSESEQQIIDKFEADMLDLEQKLFAVRGSA